MSNYGFGALGDSFKVERLSPFLSQAILERNVDERIMSKYCSLKGWSHTFLTHEFLLKIHLTIPSAWTCVYYLI